MRWCKRWSHAWYVNRNERTVLQCIFIDGYATQTQNVENAHQGVLPSYHAAIGGGPPYGGTVVSSSTLVAGRGGRSRRKAKSNIRNLSASKQQQHRDHDYDDGQGIAIKGLVTSTAAVNMVAPRGYEAAWPTVPGDSDAPSSGWPSVARGTRKRPAAPEDVKRSELGRRRSNPCLIGDGLQRLFDGFGVSLRALDGLPVPVCCECGLSTAGEGQESVSNGKHCSLRLPDDWCRIELDDCQLSPLSAPSAPELVTASCPDFYRNCSIMVGSDDCVTERSNDRTVDANVEQLFGLDEQGNIIINVGHIEEQRGRALLVKRRYRKIFSGLDHGLEIDEATRFDGMWQKLMHKLFVCCEETLVGGHPRNRNSHTGPGESIATYAFYLANKLDSTFSRNISNFIACTKESKTAPHPQVVMRNMRQFMSGMKNYLVKHGEGDFAAEVQKARAQLKSDEFLNLDSILEEVMHKLVILPLREHLYGLFVDYYSQSGDIQLIVEKVRSTAGRSPAAFGIKGNVIPPSAAAMRQIATLFVRLQEAELPLVKLDLLLAAVSAIFEGTTCLNGQQLSADDFLPVLVMVVAHCGFVGAEIEAEYMWGLLQPSLLSGEAGYYLTALCSAVHVLKNFKFNEQEGGTSTLDWDSSTMPNCSSVLRVIIPDEYNGSIQTRTLPIRPHTTTKEVCRIIAHKARITNAQDYGLFKLIDGEETLLHDTECPQDVRMTAKGKHFMIAYKRIDAKIAWPTVTPNTATVAGSNATTNAVHSTTATTTTSLSNNTIATASDNQLKV
ncbi:uncharacterized protein LOC118462021 isoform X2 [Anopheles albimanus]|uniref:uncharacterized protein LOC118462021 isoform X2 n=1 Tax=Anopheles albimanus TaxID=7167 RepID=UPI001641F27B|nr:uncharacterized protein LOC118462021 isoform X2 [Anopheles albimanus]